MNRDQLEGRVKEAKGTVERTAGDVIHDKDLQAEGSVDKAAGAVQKTYGDVANAVKKTTADVRREWREARKQHRAPRPARSAKR